MSIRINQLLKSTYRDKGTNFSVSQLTKPTYQLWVEFHSPKEAIREQQVSFKSFLGSAMHLAFENQDLPGVIQEFTWIKELDGITIGGTADRLDWRYSIGKWQLGDYKLKGEYSYKKFIEGERDKEVMQLSIYRWLFDGLFNIEDRGTIYLFMNGHTARSKYPEFQEVYLDLLPINVVESYLRNKIMVATQDTPPKKDCEDWMCGYCSAKDNCPFMNTHKKGFKDESKSK